MAFARPTSLNEWRDKLIPGAQGMAYAYPNVVFSIQTNVVNDCLMLGAISGLGGSFPHAHQRVLFTAQELLDLSMPEIGIKFREVCRLAAFHLKHGHDPVPVDPAKDYDEIMAAQEAMDKAQS